MQAIKENDISRKYTDWREEKWVQGFCGKTEGKRQL